MAYLIDIVKFLGRIERTEFCGEGDIDQARMYGVVLVAVVHIVVEILVECLGLHLTVGVSNGDDLVLCELYGSRFMDVNVS